MVCPSLFLGVGVFFTLFFLVPKLLLLTGFQSHPRSVTTVDSGSKALELLGLRDNDEEDASSPSPSSPDHQVE